MPEPITTVGLGAVAAYLSKDGLNKLLGPTAEYMGEGLKEFAQKRSENIAKIFKNSEEKLGEKLNEPGTVPPKVLKTIIDDGSYSEDEVAVEYFGGVLSSSRTKLGRDDRGANIGKIVSHLSSYQLRLHYIIYTYIRMKFKGSGYEFTLTDRSKMQILIPHIVFVLAMDFADDEVSALQSIMSHSFFGLKNEGLIETFKYGPKEEIQKSFSDAKDGGILVTPSALGAELYLWGFGHGSKELKEILNDVNFKELEGIVLVHESIQATGGQHQW